MNTIGCQALPGTGNTGLKGTETGLVLVTGLAGLPLFCPVLCRGSKKWPLMPSSHLCLICSLSSFTYLENFQGEPSVYQAPKIYQGAVKIQILLLGEAFPGGADGLIPLELP